MSTRTPSVVVAVACGILAACAHVIGVDDAGSDGGAPDAGSDVVTQADTGAATDAHADALADATADAAIDAPLDAPPDVVDAGHDAGSLDTDLLGLWNLEETKAGTAPGGADFADESGQGDHGTASTSGVTFGVAGVLGNAVGLSAGYVVLGASAPQPQAAMSAAAWIHASISQGAYPQIVTKSDSTGLTGYNLYLFNQSGQGVASFIVKEGSNGWGSCWAQGTTNLRDGAWHHVAGVYTGADISIYVDGTLQKSSACANQSIDYGSSPSGEIGAKANGSTFVGSIDQVGVWNRALSSQEVGALYDGGAGASLP